MGLLRVALALAVVLGHLPLMRFHFINAALAVQGFFVVSGFYMALVLEGKYKRAGLFYSNRLLRLAPTYFVMMVLTAIALWGVGASMTATPELFARAFSNPLTALLMVFENIFVVGQDLLFWFTMGPDGSLTLDAAGARPGETTTLAWQMLLLPQAWSLSIELLFYALAPWLTRLNWRWLALIALASLGLRLSGAFLPIDFNLWTARFFPTALFLFLFGMLAHRALPLVTRLPKAMGWIANALVLAVVVALPHSGVPSPMRPWIVYVAIAVAAPFLFNAFKDSRVDRWIGDLSYPIYLCHGLVISLMLKYLGVHTPWIIPIAGSLALSAVLLVLVEHPVDRWRQIRAKNAKPDVAIELKPETA